MRRHLLQVVFGILAVGLVLIITVNLVATDDAGPPPDPALVITLPDGGETTLGALLAEARKRNAEPAADAPVDASEQDDAAPEPPHEAALQLPPPDAAPEDVRRWATEQLTREIDPETRDLFELAQLARFRGDGGQAVALFRSVPEQHPEYARAQRYLGWEIYGELLDQPGRGVLHVNTALREAPFDGDAWYDAARTYGATLGLPVN